MYCYRYSAIHHAFIRIRNRFVRFKTSLKIYFICLSDKNTTRKKKQPSNTVRGGVSISRELRRSRNYFEQAAKKQDLSYTRFLDRDSPSGRAQANLRSRGPLEVNLSRYTTLRELEARSRISNLLCVLPQSKERQYRYTSADLERMYISLIYSATGIKSAALRTPAKPREISWIRKRQISRGFWQIDLRSSTMRKGCAPEGRFNDCPDIFSSMNKNNKNAKN